MLIDAQADMAVVSEAPDGAQAVQAARATEPHVVLMDLAMPGSGGPSTLKDIVRCCPGARVIVLTMHDDPAYLRSMLAAGASGYVLKRAVDSELLAAIRAVHRGGMFVDPSLAHVFVRDALDKATDARLTERPLNLLSGRELQVLRLVALGHGNQDIASQMLVSVKTVETYRARIAEKLGLRRRSDIVRFAIQMGLLSSDTLTPDPRKAR